MKKLYYKFNDGGEHTNIIMPLDEAIREQRLPGRRIKKGDNKSK
jgi:hypothetical protein